MTSVNKLMKKALDLKSKGLNNKEISNELHLSLPTIEIIPVETIQDVLSSILASGPKKDGLIDKLMRIVPKRKRKKLILPLTTQKKKKKSGLPADTSFGIDKPQPAE